MSSRTCSKPGCRGIIRDNKCSQCGPIRKYGWEDDKERGTRQERGYDQAWIRTRKEFIRVKTLEAATSGLSAYPICELCGKAVLDQRELHVDHIEPFSGPDDPLRLDMDNLRVTHMRCHMRHTATTAHDNHTGGRGVR